MVQQVADSYRKISVIYGDSAVPFSVVHSTQELLEDWGKLMLCLCSTLRLNHEN
jgi:hypothetical protein